jgi:hypothetical protein
VNKEKIMQGERMSIAGEIERDQWKTYLDEFSKRNQSRPTRLEVIGIEIGAQEEAEMLPLSGVSFEPKGAAAGSVEIILGGQTAADPRHLTHTAPNVRRIVPITGHESVEDGLGIEDAEGTKTLLLFKVLPEISDETSDTR